MSQLVKYKTTHFWEAAKVCYEESLEFVLSWTVTSFVKEMKKKLSYSPHSNITVTHDI